MSYAQDFHLYTSTSETRNLIYEYVEEPNSLLIGTTHMPENEQHGERDKFLKEVMSADHLIMEGDERTILAQINTKRDNYETLAFKTCKKPVYFAEDNSDLVLLANTYGINKDLFGLYRLLGQLRVVYEQSYDDIEFVANMHMILEVFRQNYPGFERVNTEKTVKRAVLLMHYLGTEDNPSSGVRMLIDYGVGIDNMLKFYLGRLRDYEILGPRSRHMHRTLNGRKVQVVGSAHIKYVLPQINGVAIDKPEEWKAFVEGLDKQYDFYKDIINICEKLAGNV